MLRRERRIYHSRNNKTMNIKKHLKALRLEYRNSRGRKLNGQYLLIESDDWGSIRQPSQEAWDEQKKKSSKTDEDPFFHFDSLESNHDMERIFGVLSKYKDRNGNHPVITADYAVANPDFQKIKDSEFKEYYFEPFTETAARYSDSDQLLKLCEQGIKSGVWKPQLHCREHVQLPGWMSALQKGDPEIMWAFEHRMISTAETVEPHNHYGYMDAFNYPESDEHELAGVVEDAVKLFRNLFGYQSKTFVASCYVWNDALERILRNNGITSMQGSWYQWVPSENGEGSFVKKVHYNGEHSGNQLYLVRNCLFEHSLFGSENCVESCLKQIESAFRWRQPAIISSHRVNYMSRLVPGNGDTGIKMLDELLREIIKRWPDVQFISSDKLAGLYNNMGNCK